jgi:hypothetical protein
MTGVGAEALRTPAMDRGSSRSQPLSGSARSWESALTLDLDVTHATNGIKFTQLERQRFKLLGLSAKDLRRLVRTAALRSRVSTRVSGSSSLG